MVGWRGEGGKGVGGVFPRSGELLTRNWVRLLTFWSEMWVAGGVIGFWSGVT